MKLLKVIFSIIGWAFAGFLLLSFLAVAVGIVAVFSGQEGTLLDVNVKSEHAVGVVELSGEILDSEDFRKQLEKAVNSDKLKALVVRINSPGGGVAASEEIFRLIQAADKKKPVVCSEGGVAASGGLYASLGCRKIVANKGTLTGSIGVILMMPNVAAIMSNAGLEMSVVKSGKFKDAGSPFRPVAGADKELLQSLVDASFKQFVDAIVEARGLEPEKVMSFSDGRIILGEQALALGLVDEIGGLERAAKVALELAGDKAEPEIVIIKKPSGIRAVFSEVGESELVQWFVNAGKTRLLYRAFI